MKMFRRSRRSPVLRLQAMGALPRRIHERDDEYFARLDHFVDWLTSS